MITSPYNFVPLAEKVFFPGWADMISHDIPFEDGVSGTIEFTITAKTPIFVRNGHTRQDAEAKNETYKSFSKTPDNKYFIPATSIKGAIRNVFEILTFSKMACVDDKRYSIRDLSSSQNQFMKFFQKKEVHCGWMKKEGDQVIISDHGVPGRISFKTLLLKLGPEFVDKMYNDNFFKNSSNRTAKKKYELAAGKDLRGKFKVLPLNPDNPVDTRKKVIFDSKGIPGTIVFTGQPGVRKDPKDTRSGKGQGKYYEFVFFDTPTPKKYSLDIYEDDGLYQDFLFIYKDSEDWKFWQNKLNKGEQIPVFFALDDKNELCHFGLSYLYKLPFPKRVKGYLPNEHNEKSLDMAQCVFGCTSKEDNSLKGRVFFSHAACVQAEEMEEQTPYMSSPKPTFYPMYLQQQGNNGYMANGNRVVFFKTMLDKDALLRGWKRYPMRNSLNQFVIPENQESNTSPFIPLAPESKFSCRVVFHNLKIEELGALICTLELPQGCLHSIGFAKPYGYGACSIDIDKESFEAININGEVVSLETCIERFRTLMDSKFSNFRNTPQIKELYAMMRPENAEKLTSPLRYMDSPNDFVEAKKQNQKKEIFGEYQQEYTKLIKKEAPVKPKNQILEAVITVYNAYSKQAKVKDSDKSFQLTVPPTFKGKLRDGDKITVEVAYSNKGKIKAMTLVKKL